MRDYLYLWHHPSSNRLIVSGLEFRDLLPDLASSAGGIVLLSHQFPDAVRDPVSHFDFVPSPALPQLAADDVHAYGDFCWADFGAGVRLADLSDDAIAELTFFAHAARPLRGVAIPGLGNRLLCWAHDDGWYARIFYDHWDAVAPLLRRLLSALLDEEQARAAHEQVRRGEDAIWCRPGTLTPCQVTEDIDGLHQQHPPRPR